ncbi:MAG: MBOAT family protein [Selenomonadaceae bacterium]|nr:MBOAT family protein [Selenomonadaceae bacterium]
MLFNSYEFIFLYIPIVFIMYFALAKYFGKRSAIFWLVITSFFFYGYWDWHYVALLFLSICFNYTIGTRIIKSVSSGYWLSFGIVGNLLILGYFKYAAFFLENINLLLGSDTFVVPNIILPLGISFFTFTQTAYLIDAYRGEVKDTSFLVYCEFVTIFPHLIAGPIINHKDMIPQFTKSQNFVMNYKNIAMGLTLFSIGLFKKQVIADKLSPWVGKAFENVDSLSFIEAWIGAISYTFQLYFDFSGYSEMAIGLGLMFNLKFPMNFDSPYKSTSIIEFWRKWHMTLGLWVKNYLYIPLGGNRRGEIRKNINLFVSMLLIGLWHGAGWTFVLWGGMHGIFLVINHWWRKLNINLPKFINWLLTFGCVVVAWVFFRAENFNDAFALLRSMTDVYNIALPANGSYEKNLGFLVNYGVDFITWKLPTQSIGTLILMGIVLTIMKNPVKYIESFQPNWKWFIVTAILILCAIYELNTYTEFLYCQF